MPEALGDLLKRLRYKRGWEFTVELVEDWRQGLNALALVIRVTCDDNFNAGRQRTTTHSFGLPAACDDWQGWVFARILDAEGHEAGEAFAIGEEHPYMPGHGPGEDRYPWRLPCPDIASGSVSS